MSLFPPRCSFLPRLAPSLAALLLLLTASLSLAADPLTVVAFGDSTTAPRGQLKVYAGLLQEELRGVRVINAGIGGHTTEMARARFERDVLAHEPRIVIIQFGINDAAVDVYKTPPAATSRVSLARYEENLRYFVRALKERKAAVILMTPNPLCWTPALKKMYNRAPYDPEQPGGMNVLMPAVCEVVRRVAREEGAELVDTEAAFFEDAKKRSGEIDKLLLDGMHPNDAGHRLIADLLRERILSVAKRDGLALERAGR